MTEPPESERVPTVDDLTASPLSRSAEMRQRYWTFMAILAVPVIAFVVLQIAGAPIWIGFVLITVTCLGLVAAEARRGRQARRRYLADKSE